MLVDSKHKHLNMQQIIKIALHQTESEHTFKVAFLAIVKELTLPNAKPIRIGNTLFIIHPSPKDSKHGMFRALNADTAANYLENSKRFVKEATKLGFQILVTQFQNRTILTIFKAIEKNPPNKGMWYTTRSLENGGYQVTLGLYGGGE